MEISTVFGPIRTVPERCRVCYTCVRECPAKAIKIVDGQARVLHERCIGCGNCVRVCSQEAKQVIPSMPDVTRILEDDAVKAAAVVAPSFAADFDEFDHSELVGMIRGLGFNWVNEVAFGADLVAAEYQRLIQDTEQSYIATTCPAVVSYIEKYFPHTVQALAPIVSPMVATARMLREIHGEDIHVVFIGPCTAKKSEGVDESLSGDIAAVLTFAELRDMFNDSGITAENCVPSDFDSPRGGMGALFPLCGGMLQAAEMREDLVEENVVTANGRSFAEAVREFDTGDLSTRLLEVLACDGCIMGAGMSSASPEFKRRSHVSRYVRTQVRERDRQEWAEAMTRFKDLNLRREFRAMDQRLDLPREEDIVNILERMGKATPQDELNCGACGYDTCREHATAIHKGLAESEMCLPYTIDRLNDTVEELALSNKSLANTQEALMQSERLASMGQLAAGIAHEVNNPLGVVLMYAHLMLEELGQDTEHGEDIRMIAEQADRCKKIVSGLLHFARQNRVLRQPTDVANLVRQCERTVIRPDNVTVTIKDELEFPTAEIDGDQITQVLTNLMSNALAAMPDGGELELGVSDTPEQVVLRVKDTGTGIPPDVRAKIFEPFFTTKQMGKGTGLGLAVTYGIVKMHRGSIRLETNHDPDAGPTGTTFFVDLPRKDENGES